MRHRIEDLPTSSGIVQDGVQPAAPVTPPSRSTRSGSAREPDLWRVPRCWPGKTVAILCGGASLRSMDVNVFYALHRVIAINQAHRLAPWADWCYGCDPRFWWTADRAALGFKGQRIVVRPATKAVSSALVKVARAGVSVLRHAGRGIFGASPDPGVVRGNNGLAQVLSIIHHTGARRVLLLGADMRPGRWHDDVPRVPEPDYARLVIPTFEPLVQPLEQAGVEVLNHTPGSALHWWPRVTLKEAFS
jgi:hypothetical protein